MNAHQPRHPSRCRIRARRQRGAALILVVVVIMILTTLGIAMVAFTTTEERSATAYRDTLQTRALAEAGVRMVQMMFADPTDRALVPVYGAASSAGSGYDFYGLTPADVETSLNAIGIFRADRTSLAVVPPRYEGNGYRLFTAPFGGSGGWGSAFAGIYADGIYDLKFSRTTAAGTYINGNWLDTNINNQITTSTDWNLDSGVITEIAFYAPPVAEGDQYGITTVRVTAVKYDGAEVLSQETVEAVIGDNNPRPAVLGNGDINFVTQGGVMCGDGCEQIHANGNATVGNISGGQDPMVTATGSITGGSGSTQPGAPAVVTPEINPWDVAYKPTKATELAKYYLVAARPLDAVWTDGNPATPANKNGRPCGLGTPPLSSCQDYNLEYAADGTVKPARSSAGVAYMYKWDAANNEWSATGCTSGANLSCGAGTPTFTVTPADDLVVAGTGDENEIPYNKLRVPRTIFAMNQWENGATVLVDGIFSKSGGLGGAIPIMSVVAVGSLRFSSNTEWYPAMENRTMWISGRDIDVQSNCCLPSNTCSTNLANNAGQSIVAAHEQIFSQSQTALAGIIIGENRVNYDNYVNSNTAINIDRGDHAYTCGLPDWPWNLPTKPVIFSIKSAGN